MPPKAAHDALSPIEKRIHAAALTSPEQTLTGEELALRLQDVPIEEQLLAINGLLKKNLFNAQKGPHGIQYVAVSRGEASMLGSMDANELIIFNHIKEARNEGLWTKLIKARTNLHQTVMTRCLRLLEQKQLVKSVKSVKFPTRKIYMLYDLTPSIELSGGPWYTDNELDTGFIHELSMACLRYVQCKTWPKDGRSSALYPASHTQHLPTASSVHRYLRGAKLTDTELEHEHVVALLDLLIYDNEIEKIPVLPMHAPSSGNDELSDDSDSDVALRRGSRHDASDSDTGPRRDSRRHERDLDSSASNDTSDNSDSSVMSVDDVSQKRRRRQSSGGRDKHRRRRHHDLHDESSSGEEEPRRRSVIPENSPSEEPLTHVPYVYRAIKRMVEPHNSMIATSFVPTQSTSSQEPCEQCNGLDYEDDVVSADPFAPFNDETDAAVKSGADTATSPAPQLGWLESTLNPNASVGG